MSLLLQKSDTSLLAQFYYADERLNCIAAELDSFDGRNDPDRCTSLVNQLRHSQVTNIKHLSYSNRLQKLNLCTSDKRRVQWHFIKTNKIVHGLHYVNCSRAAFTLCSESVRMKICFAWMDTDVFVRIHAVFVADTYEFGMQSGS